MNEAENRESPHRSTRIDIQVIAPDRSNQFVTVIPADVLLPHEYEGSFSFAFDGMHAVRIMLRTPSGLLPPVQLQNLPKGRRGTELDIRIVYEPDHILRVRVVHVDTGREVTEMFPLPG